MSERGQKAQTGLDLALGRGGDQAAVYVNEEVQFYGGKAKVMEKSTRVKARVVAHAIRELMQEAGDVLVMGHEGEDFDSLGAAMGVARMATHLGKKGNIVVGTVALSFEKLRELLPEMGLTITGPEKSRLSRRASSRAPAARLHSRGAAGRSRSAAVRWAPAGGRGRGATAGRAWPGGCGKFRRLGAVARGRPTRG